MSERYTLSTFFSEDGDPDLHFVKRIWRKGETGPFIHDWVRGPFATKAEARAALAEIEAHRYAAPVESEGGSHD